MSDTQPQCRICGRASALFDVVDFNKSCEEARGVFLPLSGDPIYYVRCATCGFVSAPAVAAWPLEAFERRIYNAEYVQVDPDYLEVRPLGNAQFVHDTFGRAGAKPRHLDYGGGNGVLSRRLNQLGWQSASFDPFVDRATDASSLGRFDLITAFEVFEHVPDPHALMNTLDALLNPGGLLLFSTLVSDGQIQPGQRLSWWYAAPRNGHISLFSQHSLTLLAESRQFKLGSFSAGFHVMFRSIPSWASHVFGTAPPQA